MAIAAADPIDLPVVSAASVSVAPSGAGIVSPGYDRRVVIVTLPMAGRPRAAASVEARRAIPDGSPSDPPGAGETPAGADDLSAAGTPAALDAAVLAAHETRIALLRRLAVSLRDGGAPDAILTGLRERLRRAEAARSVALGRIASDRGSRRSDVEGSTYPITAMAGSTGASGRHRPEARHRSIAVETFGVAAQVKVGRSAPYRFSHASVARGDPLGFAGRAVVARRIAAHDLRGVGIERRLASARRSLIVARRLLGGDQATAVEHRPPLRLTGLWQWQGSGDWTLTPERAHAST